MVPNKMIGTDQGEPESLRSEPFIKKEDIPVIVETLASGTVDKETGNDALDVSSVFGKDWSLLLLIAIDLGVDVKEIKAIKEGLESGSVTDAEGLSQILSSWIDKRGNEATWNILIAVFSSNIKNYQQGDKDYVGLLRQLNPDNSDDQLESLVAKAFQIDLIRDAILKRISFEDKKSLRLISRRVHDAMLRDWREKLASLQITENEAGQFETFFGHFVEAEDGKFKEGSGAFEIPFLGYHFYSIDSLNLYRPISRPIWINYGTNMKQLSFSSCSIVINMGIPEMLKWLLLIACPNLESLRFLSYDYYDKDETEPEMGKQLYPVGAIAEKLKTLELRLHPDMSLEPEEHKQIIEILPNIESLRINQGLDILEDFLLSTEQPEAVKLHTLKVDLDKRLGESFDSLQRFTSHYPATLKDLSLSDIDLSSGAIRWFPNLLYSFYLGIGHCTSLASLVLHFSHLSDNWDWITLLSTMEFPLLKTFKIKLVRRGHKMKFDFTALKGMPQLKSLSVTTCIYDKSYTRLPGNADYIYEGPLAPFIPSGKNPFKEHPQDSPIYLEHLEKFKFNLWGLKSSDLDLLSEWFPNLRILQAELYIRESFVLTMFPKLEMLVLPNRTEACLLDWKRILENFKNLSVIVKFIHNKAELKLGNDGKAYLIDL